MVKLGYKLMSEEHGPADLVRNAKRAEEAGFDFAAISDHYFPWLEEQGHAPVRLVGARRHRRGDRASRPDDGGDLPDHALSPGDHRPGDGDHGPAVGRIASRWASVPANGSTNMSSAPAGRASSSAMSGSAEALDIIQGLLAGKLTTYRGQHFQLDHAKLFDRPKRKPPVIVAAGGPEAARLAGEKADGLIVTEPEKELVKAFTSSGGKGPRYAEVAMCCAAYRRAGAQDGASLFPMVAAGWPVLAELPHDEAFAAASEHVSVETIGKEMSCGPSADRHLEAIQNSSPSAAITSS